MAKIRTVLTEMNAESKSRGFPNPYVNLGLIAIIGYCALSVIAIENKGPLAYIGLGLMLASALVYFISFVMRYADVRKRIARNSAKTK